MLSRFAAARTAVACRELVGGSSFRQLSQAVVDISRVPRLTAIRLSEVVSLQKIVRHYSQYHATTFRAENHIKPEFCNSNYC